MPGQIDSGSKLLMLSVMCLTCMAIGSASALQPDSSLTCPAKPGEIAELVRDLESEVYDTRTFATRRLCAIGISARDALRKAADSDSFELAMRAEAVLAILDQILFSGVDVELQFSADKTAWDKPVDLIVTFANRSKYPARLPFATKSISEEGQSRETRQVLTMLNFADWLVVQRMGSQAPMSVTVEDIGLDSTIQTAVEKSIESTEFSILKPGEQAEMRISPFNRGFARYRMLDEGVYQARFVYLPEWNDPVLLEARAGSVESNAVQIQLTAAAPQTVARHNSTAKLVLQEEEQQVVARIINRHDLPIVVNLNAGPAVPFAQMRWVVTTQTGHERMVPAWGGTTDTLRDFKAKLLKTVPPGEAVILFQLPKKELSETIVKELGKDAGKPVAIRLRYSNILSRRWQQLRIKEIKSTNPDNALNKPVPRELITLDLISDAITLRHEP